MSVLPDSMRCVIAKEKGGPEVLTVETRPVPKPRAGEVLLKVDYAGVSRPDIMQRKGIFVPPPGANDILGFEAAGTVAACGDGVTDLKVGDRVAAIPVLITRGANSQSVAELAIGLTLAVGRRLLQFDQKTRQGHWDRTVNPGIELNSKVLGIVGYGSIGKKVAALAKAFGAKVESGSARQRTRDDRRPVLENGRQVAWLTARQQLPIR